MTTEHIIEETFSAGWIALYRTDDSVSSRMRLVLKRPFVLEQSGERIRRFKSLSRAKAAYYAARDEMV